MISHVVLIGIIIVLVVLLYMCHTHNIDQRIWPVPEIKPTEELIVFLADQVMDSDKLFLVDTPGNTIPSVFSNAERAVVQKEAYEYFQKQFGLSDAFLKAGMFELVVNDRANYHVEYMSSRPNNKFKIIDGGYTAYIPKGMKLHGRYGGKKGVASDLPGVLAYGYYMFGNYKIKYYGLCPLTTLKTYDGNYTFVDCEVEIVQGHHVNSQRPNMKGKAQGVYIDKKVSNGLNHVVIRNVLTF